MRTDDFDQAVLEFMREYGVAGQYVSAAEGSYDPATGTVTQANTYIPVDVLLMDLTLQSNGLTTKYGTNIVAGDKAAYIRSPRTDEVPVTINVRPGVDKLLVNGITYNIVTFKEINPTGTDQILLDLYLRR